MEIQSERTASEPLAAYFRDLGNEAHVISREEEQLLARRYRAGDAPAGNALVVANLRFAVKVAREYLGYGHPLAELIQEGNLGLLKALRKFDPERGVRFSTYSSWWIRAFMQMYVIRNWSLVKTGTTQAQRTLFFKLAKTKRRLAAIHGDDDPDLLRMRVAAELKVDAEDVAKMETRLERHDMSLDAPVGNDGSTVTHLDLLPDPRPQGAFEDAESAAYAKVAIAEALPSLDDRERFIVERRIMAESPLTLKEVGEHFGLSRERARQLETRAKDKLRDALGPHQDDLC